MFVLSMRAKKLRGLCYTVLGLIALAVGVYCVTVSIGDAEETDGIKVESVDEMVAYIESYGWEVEPTPSEQVTVTVPMEFDDVYLNYNELQLEQGFDLTQYQGKEVTRTSFVLLNYPSYPDNMCVDVLTYENEVVAADVCSLELQGFMTQLVGGLSLATN